MKDLTGQVFGRLTVISRGEDSVLPSGQRSLRYLCQCSCGSDTRLVFAGHLRSSDGTRSCGCLGIEGLTGRSTTHGMKHAPEYKTWRSVIDRATSPNHKQAKKYNERGVDNDWLVFENFYRDMGTRPSPKHSIERIDNEKGYSASNCKWATRAEQARNRSNTVTLTFEGRTQCIADWVAETGIPRTTIFNRRRRNCSVEQTLTKLIMRN